MIKIHIIEIVRNIRGYEAKNLKEAKRFIKDFKLFISPIDIEVYDDDKLVYKTKKK